MEQRNLLDAATRGEWMLEHDKKVLDIMQNIASKIEKRAVNTKTNINTMMLNLDETRVKMSNLTRISDVKNAVYCENLITDDHHIPSSSSDAQVPQKKVRQSTDVAIANGIKLVENCFEKHRIKLDPSSSRSEETIVYRPIDQFYSPLPYLIGSDKWKEKWHLGLMENEDRQSQTGSVYADSVDSSVVSRPNEQNAMSTHAVDLSASQDSLAKSINSVGDQMVINSKQGGLFDEPIDTSEPSIYKPQSIARNIVNFFDDEPPEMPSVDPSPIAKRKPTNLFDDVESVESMPIHEPEINQEIQQKPLPPVDLFNDNDFDDFITKMEKNRNTTPKVESVNAVKPQSEEKVIVNVQRDMKNIAEEISKKVQLKKVDPAPKVQLRKEDPEVVKKVESVVKKTEPAPMPKVVDNFKKIEIEPKEEIKSTPKPKQRINLFDDEDDSEDFFKKIIEEKAESKQPQVRSVPEKKISNLFGESSEEEDHFENIFKNSAPKVSVTKMPSTEPPKSKVSRNLFDDEDTPITKQETPKKLFDDMTDEDDNLFKSDSKHTTQVGQTNAVFSDESEIIQTTVAENKNNIDTQESQLPNLESETKNVIDVLQEFDDFVPVENESPPDDMMISDEKMLASNENENLSQQIEKEQKNSFNDSIANSNFTMPLISDEPPDDDTWDEEFNNFEEPETKPIDRSTFSPNTSSYSVPLFDEFPPDDDGPPPIPDFEEELSDYESQLEVPHIEEIKDKDENIPQFVAVDKEKSELLNEVENKSITGDSTEIIKEKNEAFPDVSNASIKSKLDMFSRSPETIVTKPSEPKKLPGKLNTNLNINVGALMPGARIPIKKTVEEPQAEVSEPSEATKPIQSSESSGLLNNDITKSRAKISVKRRPSTRSGRRSNYEKSLADSEESKRDESNVATDPMPPIKNLSQSIFAENDEKPQKVTTSKVSVFYDDEEETKKMLEEQKLIKKEPLKLFDEASEDDNLFTNLNARVTEKLVPKQNIEEKQVKKLSLFEDDNGDDDLFGSKTVNKETHNKKDSQIKSKPLFDDDSDEDDLFGSSSHDKKPIKKIPQTKSLFGDDDSDDDLFSAKPKSATSKPSSSKSTVKSSKNTIVDDPLKDLM